MRDRDNDLRGAAERFIAAFEAVFHHDWEYTKDMLGIDEAAEDRPAADLLELFGEQPSPRDPSATFLDPRGDLDADNWGNYDALLAAYAALKRALASAPPR